MKPPRGTTSRRQTTALDLPDPPARDVYLSAVWANDGSPVMFAVDSQGRTAGKVVLRGIVTREAAERILWARLDEIDPPAPKLELIWGGPA